ncbi:hypothetical protein MUB42_05505 [Apilactobacillus kunkeei]|nr:hypothetical protein MUB42_05505 [Apilactobacillus kunkeei]
MNFIKNFKAKSPKAFWAIIVVIVALVVVGFVNNKKNGSPISFSETPQKFISEAADKKQIWKVTFPDGETNFFKFSADSDVLYFTSSHINYKVDYDTQAKYDFVKPNSFKMIAVAGPYKGQALRQFNDLKIVDNKIEGNIYQNIAGKVNTGKITFEPAGYDR